MLSHNNYGDAAIQKWDDSLGICVPKAMLEAIGVHENDQVELYQSGNAIIVQKINAAKHRSLEERLSQFYGKPIEEIGRIDDVPEPDWNASR